MSQFDLTRKDTLMDKMVMHLQVLCPCVEDTVPRKLDAAEVVRIDHCQIRHLLMQVLE
jgi:hypothetical protein